MKSADKTVFWAVSELPGRNASDHRGSLEKLNFEGRAIVQLAKAVWGKRKLTDTLASLQRGVSDSTAAQDVPGDWGSPTRSGLETAEAR